MTFPGVCWRAVNGQVREQSGDVLANKNFSGTERGVAILSLKLLRLRAGYAAIRSSNDHDLEVYVRY